MNIISHGHNTLSQGAESDPEVVRLRRELAEFPLGRFLLENLGLNGHWTSYVLLYPDKGRATATSSDGQPITELESWLMDRCPILRATQERFRIFRGLTQSRLRPGMSLASLPAGLMDDLLTLDYTQTPGVTLTAVDLDPETLGEAEQNFRQLNPPVDVTFEQKDAWQLCTEQRWDLLTSNGLNIYVDDDERCTDFYRSVWQALKPNGIFVFSFITPADQWLPEDPQDLEFQRFLFSKVIPVKWSCVRSEQTTRDQLAESGFTVESICYDTQRMFPAVVARKKTQESQ